MTINVKTFCLPAKLEISGREIGLTVIEVAVFICPDCDLTHCEISTVGGGIIFRIAGDAKDMEKFGQQLINPPAADPNEVHTPR